MVELPPQACGPRAGDHMQGSHHPMSHRVLGTFRHNVEAFMETRSSFCVIMKASIQLDETTVDSFSP